MQSSEQRALAWRSAEQFSVLAFPVSGLAVLLSPPQWILSLFPYLWNESFSVEFLWVFGGTSSFFVRPSYTRRDSLASHQCPRH